MSNQSLSGSPHPQPLAEGETYKDRVYNSLTLEAIRSIFMLIRFGFFTEKGKHKAQNIRTLEEILCYLSYLLEYDDDYYREVNSYLPQLKWSNCTRLLLALLCVLAPAYCAC